MAEAVRIVVCASGAGSNFRSLIGSLHGGGLARVVALLTDREDAGARALAKSAGISEKVVTPADLGHALEAEAPDLIVLAGYLRLVPADVVRRFAGRIVNIHPALLPSFGGKGMYGIKVHQAVIDSGARWSGATVHLVDDLYDQGAILAQWPVPVLVPDSAEALATRILQVEHKLYPATIEACCKAIQRGLPLSSLSFAPAWPSDSESIRRALNLES